MPEKLKEVSPPKGLWRALFRAPLWLYRANLGRVLGHRFLRLTHTGRKSGLPRQTVLEVVRYDADTGDFVIAAGFGNKSDWVQNILADPNVEVESASIHARAIASLLTPDEAGEEMVNYSHRYPAAFRELVRVLGFSVDGSDADTRSLGELIPMFILKPI